MQPSKFVRWTLAALVSAAAVLGSAAPFPNPIDVPATRTMLMTRAPLLAVTHAGDRLIAVGERGDIVYSDDTGAHWTQAIVPVSTDLVAVVFIDNRRGWAVGHGGVVLHSEDGGATWVKQLDGREAAALALKYYEATALRDADAAKYVQREKRLIADGGTQPFLDVYFENATSGFVVGTFNRIFHTDDGGKSWQPWMDRTDNADELHFYAVHGAGDAVYLAGEQGMVWRLDKNAGRFRALHTPYKGTLFGLLAEGPTLLAYGMRGSLYRSNDAGATWTRVDTGQIAGITAGAVIPDGAIVLVTQAGGILISHNQGISFVRVSPARPMRYYGVMAIDKSHVALVGAEGVRQEFLR